MNYEEMKSTLASQRPGKKIGDPVVTNICKLIYADDGRTYFKIHHSNIWEELIKRSMTPFDSLGNLYRWPLPIRESKLRHL